MKNKSILLIIAVCLGIMILALSLVSACAQSSTSSTPSTASSPSSTASTTQQAVEIKLAHMFALGTPIADHAQRWADKITADSGGRVTVRIYPADTLLKAPDLWDGIMKGIADAGFSFARPVADAPLNQTFSGLFKLPDKAPSTVDVLKVWNDTYAQFQEVRAEWDQVKVLWFGFQDPWHLAANKPIKSLADMKGMQIRVSQKLGADAIAAWGGSPVSMPMGDTLTALQKGTVNGAMVPYDGLNAFKLADVLHYGTFLNFYEPLFFAVMSKDKYNSLPPDVQQIINDSISWGTQDATKTLSSLQTIGIEYAKTKNFEFTTLSPDELSKWRDQLTPVQEGWAKDLDNKGLPGTKMMQFQQARLASYEGQ